MEIFATLGPGCSDENTIYEMLHAGMTGMRLNLSHGDLAGSTSLLAGFYSSSKRFFNEKNKAPELLIDLQGPELRIGKLKGDITLSEGDITIIPLPPHVLSLLKTGDRVLIDDGKLYGEVESREPDVKIRVIRGGVLKSSKSIKIEDLETPLPTLTPQDIDTLSKARDYGISCVMLPFVRDAADIAALRSHLRDDLRIFAKIENMTGVEQVDEIIAALNPARDMLVIARGDLGNDMPLWELPRVQKQLEDACHRTRMPYLVVTELLSSMVTSPTPTRAEVSDVYHAIYHGAAALMVTNETAVGRHPVEVIRYMNNIAAQFPATGRSVITPKTHP